MVYSTDGGQNFRFLAFVGNGTGPGAQQVDYPSIATGPGNMPNQGSVWLAWKAGNNKVVAAGASVTGQGQIGAFVDTKTVNGSDDMGQATIQVGPDGRVMVSFQTIYPGLDPTEIYVSVDEDGLGPNGFWTVPTFVTTTTVVMNPTITPPTQLYVIPAQTNRGITPQVNLAWDRSGLFRPGPHGRVYMVYTYAFPEIGGDDTDIFVQYSDDSGMTWQAPQIVHTPNANSQFLPSIAVDQTTGHVAVIWLDARDDHPANRKVRLLGTVSVNGGASYRENEVVLSAGQSDAAVANVHQRGVTTGENGQLTLWDTNQNWTPDHYWATDSYNVLITGTGAANGQRRGITGSFAKRLLVQDWTDPMGVVPVQGEPYEIQHFVGLNVQDQPVYDIYRFDFGDYTGVAFHNGYFYPIWADTSNSTNDNPNEANRALDVYTARVEVLIVEDNPLGAGGTGGAASTSARTYTVSLGTRRFTGVPQARLLEAALLLGGQRTFRTRPPSAAIYSQFVRDTQAKIQKLAARASASPTSPAALLLGGSTPRLTPSIEAIDRFFSAAWADGVLNELDLLRTLG